MADIFWGGEGGEGGKGGKGGREREREGKRHWKDEEIERESKAKNWRDVAQKKNTFNDISFGWKQSIPYNQIPVWDSVHYHAEILISISIYMIICTHCVLTCCHGRLHKLLLDWRTQGKENHSDSASLS